MTTAAFLTDLKRRGVEIWADGDRLRFSAPKGVLDDGLRDELRRHKDYLLKLLQEDTPRESSRSSEQSDHAVMAAPTARARPVERKISLTGNERLAPPSIDDLPRHAHPYGQYVGPYKYFLFSQLGLDKRFVRGERCYLYDEIGNRYVDLIAQYGALPFGFNPPEIWDALLEARDRLTPSFVNPGLMDAAGELAERLVRIAPGDMRHVTFANSGTEAVEVALKLARSATKRNGVLSTENAFHGLTLGSMSATGREMFQRNFGAPVPGFDRVPYGDLEALRAALAGRPGYYAAFLVEPIQGEGGIVEAPSGYLNGAKRLCSDVGVLLIADEVQTGLGRTGTMFACEHAGVNPDILVLAKALGGGLMPIGACVYTSAVYNIYFELWHSSTFAGNTLACCAGVAVLNMLEAQDRALVRHIAENGEALKRQLEDLKSRYPRLISEIRGRGYMLGLEFAFDEDGLGSDLLVHLAEQQLLLQIVVGYLLNVERVRVAPAFAGAPVLRIEPPLIAGREEWSALIHALDRTLELLQKGDAGALFGYMVLGQSEDVPCHATVAKSDSLRASHREYHRGHVDTSGTRFAFLVHLLSSRDYADFDPSFSDFNEKQLDELHRRISHFVDPFPVGAISVRSPAGGGAVGELILIPHTAEELMHLPAETALAEVLRAVEIAKARGAEIVGLGGFTSIVTQGGMSLTGPNLPRLTNGNSYTVVMAKRAVELGCRQRGVKLEDATVAIVGAGGIISRAAALLMAESVSRMILVGNPLLPERSVSKLLDIACEAAEHALAARHQGRTSGDQTLAAHLAGLAEKAGGRRDVLKNLLVSDDRLSLTTDFDAKLPQADIVISATNSVDVLIFERHLKRGAVVCDVSRPFNVCRDIRKTRPDVMLIDGGTVEVAGEADVRALRGGHDRHVPACVAETILLSFERAYDLPGLYGPLQLETIAKLEGFGRKHGFDVVLEGDEWDLGEFAHHGDPRASAETIATGPSVE
ncbi:MAG: aminotransferase class III-fold pyridoxal phosphate-dependent enzyme [Planctomycetes bacterium]|nr:aminotransferase class III-fold pyridoxal phosphate-dependent enzyme [Planctomycetota bacterium]MBI3832897.1 aminotransferase class III-fold pyridoxal phosphate-dependent enzyme [Planctomycetota bacterium]